MLLLLHETFVFLIASKNYLFSLPNLHFSALIHIFIAWRRDRGLKRETEKQKVISSIQNGLIKVKKLQLRHGVSWKSTNSTASTQSIGMLLTLQRLLEQMMFSQQNLIHGSMLICPNEVTLCSCCSWFLLLLNNFFGVMQNLIRDYLWPSLLCNLT